MHPEHAVQQEQDDSMKLFHLPDGLQVWSAPGSGGDMDFLYREILERHAYEKHGVAVSDGDVIFGVAANIG